MSELVGFRIKIDGADDLTKTELALEKINEEIRQAKKEQNTPVYGRLRREQLVLQEEAKKLRKDIRTQIKDWQDVKKSIPTDSIIGLRKQYRDLTKQINEMSAAQRNSDFGKNVAKEAKSIKAELDKVEQSMGSFRGNVGNYRGFLSGLGGAVSGIVSGDPLQAMSLLTGQFTNMANIIGVGGPWGAAISGAIGITAQFTHELIRTQEELINIEGQISKTIGEVGKGYGDRFKAISETFNVETNEIISAVNSLVKQLDIELDPALELIEKGFLAGANANGQFLELVKEYPAQMDAAGISAEEFIVLITKQIQEGVFSDKGIDAIKEATISIREMTPATAEALSALGIDNARVDKIMKEEGILGMIKEVSKLMKELPADSKIVGQVMADVFRGAGEDAGAAWLTVFEDLDSDIDDVIDRTDKLTARTAKQLEVNKKINEEWEKLGAFIEPNTGELSLFFKQIKADALGVLNVLLDWGSNIEAPAYGYGMYAGMIDNVNASIDESNKKIGDTIDILSKMGGANNFFSKVQNNSLTDSANFAGKSAVPKASTRPTTGNTDDGDPKNPPPPKGTIAWHRWQLNKLNSELKEGIGSNASDNVISKILKDIISHENEIEVFQQRVSAIKDSLLGVDHLPALEDSIDLDASKELSITAIKASNKEVDSFEQDRLKEELDNLKFLSDLESNIEQELHDEQMAMLQEYEDAAMEVDKEIFNNQRALNEVIQQEKLRAGLETAQTIASSIFQIEYNNAQRQLNEESDRLDEQYKKRMEAAEGNADLQNKLQEELASKQDQLAREAFEDNKNRQIAEALINGALAITQSLANTVLPFPASLIAPAAITAQTAAQIAVISSQSYDEGGFTGYGGIMDPNIPGRRISGYVHDNEYVAPTIQIRKYPQLFKFLESDRLGQLRGFERGGFTTPPLDYGTILDGLASSASLGRGISADDLADIISRAVYEGSRRGSQEGTLVGSKEGAKAGSFEGTKDGTKEATKESELERLRVQRSIKNLKQ